MIPVFAYIRVSTVRQGTQGVSLQEQRAAIARFADTRGLRVTEWFEETETAARIGRPAYARMLALLRSGAAKGVVIHKIDRSARNLRDWVDLGEFIDLGLEIHFVADGIDLRSNGGRLSADIQAVIAANYVRNLREEIKKGFYGRLKQGLYPLPAPIGYLDCGKGKPKEIDPVRGPLIRTAFQLYATGAYPLRDLCKELRKRGLAIRPNRLSAALNNPFYMGVIRIASTQETFPGIHERLVSPDLFIRVRDVLRGKAQRTGYRQRALFSRLLRCHACGYSLIGELQKGHRYYRCHTESCSRTCLREDAISTVFEEKLQAISFEPVHARFFEDALGSLRDNWAVDKEAVAQSLRLRLERVDARISRLTDTYLDALIDRTSFEGRREELVSERERLSDRLKEVVTGTASHLDRAAEYLRLAHSALEVFETGTLEESRDLISLTTSNRIVDGKDVVVGLSEPFASLARTKERLNGLRKTSNRSSEPETPAVEPPKQPATDTPRRKSPNGGPFRTRTSQRRGPPLVSSLNDKVRHQVVCQMISTLVRRVAHYQPNPIRNA